MLFPEKAPIDPNVDYKRIGLFVGHELFINRLSIETQLGYYVYKPFKYEVSVYQRLALKYYLTKSIYRIRFKNTWRKSRSDRIYNRRKIMKKIVALIFVSILLVSCGISEDCFKNKGTIKTKSIDVEGFTKIRIHSGIALIIKQGDLVEVKVESGENIIDNIVVSKENDLLILKNMSTCNWTRDYEAAKVYVTAPNIVEIHSKTEQKLALTEY